MGKISDLAGIDPGFTGGLSPEDYLLNLGAGEDIVALRAAAQAVVDCPLIDNACEHVRALAEMLARYKK